MTFQLELKQEKKRKYNVIKLLCPPIDYVRKRQVAGQASQVSQNIALVFENAFLCGAGDKSDDYLKGSVTR